MVKNDNKRKANDDHDEDDDDDHDDDAEEEVDEDADADFTNSSTGSQESDSGTSRKRMNTKSRRTTAKGRRVLPRKKRAYRTQASLSSRAVLDHVKTMFEQQAQLWKQHADAMENASSSNDNTGVIAQQQPWHGLLNNNRSLATDTSDAKTAAVEDLTQSLTSLQNRTYTRQAMPGQDNDNYEPSSSEDDDESDN